MAVVGCELRRGDDGTMRARDKESHRGFALSYRIHTLPFFSSSILPNFFYFSFSFFPHFFPSFLFFSFLFVFICLTAYAIIAFIPGKSKYGNKQKGKGNRRLFTPSCLSKKKTGTPRKETSRLVCRV